MSNGTLDFDAALAKLQALLGEEINIQVSDSEGTSVPVLQIRGVLESGWPDPEVARANGLEDVMPFHLRDQPHSGVFIDAAAFRTASMSQGILRIVLESVEVAVWLADDQDVA